MRRSGRCFAAIGATLRADRVLGGLKPFSARPGGQAETARLATPNACEAAAPLCAVIKHENPRAERRGVLAAAFLRLRDRRMHRRRSASGRWATARAVCEPAAACHRTSGSAGLGGARSQRHKGATPSFAAGILPIGPAGTGEPYGQVL